MALFPAIKLLRDAVEKVTMTSTRKVIEVAANIAIFAACGLICWTFFHASRSVRGDTSVTRFNGLTEPPLSGYSYASHRETLILAIHNGCHYCEESMPF